MNNINRFASILRFKDLPVLLSLFLYAIILILYSSTVQWYTADTSCYIGLAESIINHGKYVFNFVQHTKYPPGYPLFLSAIMYFSGFEVNTIPVFICATGLFGLIGLYFSYLVLKRYNWKAALFFIFFILFSPNYFFLSSREIMSDLPFFTCAFFSIYLFSLLYTRNKHSIIIITLLSLSTVACILLRSAGISLPFAMIMFLIFNALKIKKLPDHTLRMFIVPITLSLLVQVLWIYWSSHNQILEFPGQYMDSYFMQIRYLNPHKPELGLASFTDLIIRIFRNTTIHISYTIQLLIHLWISPFPLSPFYTIPFMLIVVTIVKRLLLNEIDFLFCFFVTYSFMILIWPFDEGIRFTLPVFPVIILYCIEGYQTFKIVFRKYSDIALKICISILFTFAIIALFILSKDRIRGIQNLFSCYLWITLFILSLPLLIKKSFYGRLINYTQGSFFNLFFILPLVFTSFIGLYHEYQICKTNRNQATLNTRNNATASAAEWVRSNLSRNAIIMTDQRDIIHQVSGRKAISFPVSSSDSFLVSVINLHNINYLITANQGDYPYFIPSDNERINLIVKSNPDLLSLVHEEENFKVFRVNLLHSP